MGDYLNFLIGAEATKIKKFTNYLWHIYQLWFISLFIFEKNSYFCLSLNSFRVLSRKKKKQKIEELGCKAKEKLKKKVFFFNLFCVFLKKKKKLPYVT
jgi:hypothetical protein